MTSAPPAVRIIVADDHHVVRTGFAGLLGTQPDFTVVGTAGDVYTKIDTIKKRRLRACSARRLKSEHAGAANRSPYLDPRRTLPVDFRGFAGRSAEI